jgi:hypothetical protein
MTAQQAQDNKSARAREKAKLKDAAYDQETTGIEGITGAMNEQPDGKDDDENDAAAAEEQWQVREPKRLLEDSRAIGRSTIDGSSSQDDGRGRVHERRWKRNGPSETRRGTSATENRSKVLPPCPFYMDESEWDQSDR